jgi:predicted ATPase
MLGELVSARAHLDQGIALYDPQQHRAHAFLYGQDPGVAIRCYAALTLWLLGYPDQARTRGYEAFTLAQELSHPFSLAYALGHVATFHQFGREAQATHERADAEIGLCTEQRFAYYLARGTMLRGWALAERGQGAEGMAQVRQGLAAEQATGAKLQRPYYLALLAETYGKVGQAKEGLRVVAEALAAVHNSGERFYEAELHRLKGELLLHTVSDEPQVEACFLQALDVSHRQQAKSLELRAAMSLSRLWQRQGKHAEARQLLAPIYGWFTEGFDTADLQEAKALLAALSCIGQS